MKKIAIAFTFFFLWVSNVQAQTQFFAGKTIRIIVGLPAGDVRHLCARRGETWASIFREITASWCKICPVLPP